MSAAYWADKVKWEEGEKYTEKQEQLSANELAFLNDYLNAQKTYQERGQKL